MSVARSLSLFGCGLTALAPPVAGEESFSPGVEYTVDLMRNQKGGLKQGGTWLDNLIVDLTVDGESLLNWPGLSGYGSLLSTNSNTFSDQYSGDLQTVSNIDTTAAVRLYELWLQQAWQSGSLLAGVYDLNSEFDTIDGGALFLNSSMGIGPDFSQSGANGPSIFPTAGLAVRLDQALTDTIRLHAGLFEATPGDPDHPANTTIRLADNEGWLGVMEMEGRPGQWRWLVGGWGYSKAVATTLGDDESHNRGAYTTLEYGIDGPVSDAASRLFIRLGVADSKVNPIDRYMGFGVNHNLLLFDWPAATTGVAIAHAVMADDYRTLAASDSAETAIELTWQQPVTAWLSLQPDLQYVINPGADPALANSLVLGLRITLTPFAP